MGIPLISGRPFTPDDRLGTPPVAIVNQSLARQYWPGENPLGKRLRINNSDEPPWLEVVGVVNDFLYGLQEPPIPAFYYPMAQSPRTSQAIVIKTSVAPSGLVAPVRQIFREVDKGMPVTVSVLQDRIERSDALIVGRFAMIVFGMLAAAAGFLAILGIYGVLSYAVTQRTREIGIRLAIGADKRSVLGSVLLRGLAMAGVGLIAGLLGSVAAARVLGSMLFGVHPNDPLTLASVAMVIFVSATLAGYLPARRATKVDPISILRCE
jgi:putative ABC transport system permease protein